MPVTHTGAGVVQASYAGTPFCLETPQLRAKLERQGWRWDDLRHLTALPEQPDWTLAGINSANWPKMPVLDLGTLYYPSGASRWAQFTGIATGAQVQAMLTATNGGAADFIMQADLQGGQAPGVSIPDALATGGIKTKLSMLPPRPLGRYPGAGDRYYLVTLVDERYFWQFNQGSVSATTFNPDLTRTTWAVLLAGLIPGTVTILTIPSVYGYPSEDSYLGDGPSAGHLGRMIDAVAWNCGLLFVRNLDGTYQLQTSTQAQNQLDASRSLPISAGGDPFDTTVLGTAPLNGYLPAAISTTFPQFVQNGTFVANTTGLDNQPTYLRDSRDWFKINWPTAYLSNATIQQAGFDQQGKLTGSGFVTFRNTARAYYTADPPTGQQPLNKTNLDALALQLAQNHYAAMLGGVDEVYPYLRAWPPDGFSDIHWRLCWDADKNEPYAWTRIQRKPFNCFPCDFQHELNPDLAGTSSTTGLTVDNLGADMAGLNATRTNVTTISVDPLTLAAGPTSGSPGIAKMSVELDVWQTSFSQSVTMPSAAFNIVLPAWTRKSNNINPPGGFVRDGRWLLLVNVITFPALAAPPTMLLQFDLTGNGLLLSYGGVRSWQGETGSAQAVIDGIANSQPWPDHVAISSGATGTFTCTMTLTVIRIG